MFPLRQHCALIAFALFLAGIAVGCGGGSSSLHFVPPPPAPTFSSAPVTVAFEGLAYNYTLAAVDPSGGTVTFQLTTAPAGAQLTGDTINWIPTAAQSRVPNNFTVTATTSHGASGKQSWTVTPDGIVRVTAVDTYWDESGSTNTNRLPVPAGGVLIGAVLVPQADGSYLSRNGTLDADGVLNIPGVPAGYYWLRLPPRSMFWTSTSAFDAGSEFIGSPPFFAAPGPASVTFEFSFSGLDPVPSFGHIEVFTKRLSFVGSTLPGATVYSSNSTFSPGIIPDFSSVKTAYVMQYKPASFGAINGDVLGPALIIPDVTWSNSGTNTLTGSLVPTPLKTLNLNIKGSAWTPLFDRVSPAPVTQVGTPFSLTAQVGSPPASIYAHGLTAIPLLAPNVIGTIDGGFSAAGTSGCGTFFAPSSNFWTPPIINSDQDLGAIQYGDPFPSSWPRTFALCQQAAAEITVHGSSTPSKIILSNGQITSAPIGPVVPLVGPVQNPTIDSADLFTATSVNTTSPTLSWSAPAVGKPYGYRVQVLTSAAAPDGTVLWAPTVALSTSKTSMTIPSGVLSSAQTYVFLITALSDARANIETSPARFALPNGHAEVISGVITVSSSAVP